jgi:hypothetical protein
VSGYTASDLKDAHGGGDGDQRAVVRLHGAGGENHPGALGQCVAEQGRQRWQLTGHDGELRLGNSLLRGPIERDQHFGTCRIEARRARGPLRPPARMRLDIEPWSPTATALELIPCQRVRPSAAYFAAGHRLLDSLTRPLPVRVPVQQRPDQDYLRAAVSAGGPALSRA